MEKKFKSVVELSGGADSALVALRLKKEGKVVYPCFVNYGQPYIAEEIHACEHISNLLMLAPPHVVKVDGLKFDRGKVFIPFRNVLITTLALNYAASIDAGEVCSGSKGIGYVEEDPYSYTDSTLIFYQMMQGLVDYLNIHNVKVRVPLAENRHDKMKKNEVFEELELNGITLDDIFNCFFPVKGKPCGECNNCQVMNEYRESKKKGE